jgi:hypothetical protein
VWASGSNPRPSSRTVTRTVESSHHDLDVGAARAAALCGVVEGLLDDAVHRGLDLARVSVRLAALLVGEVDGEIHVEPTAPCALGEIFDRRLRAEVLERSRAKVGDGCPERANLVLELGDGVAHRLDRCRRFGGLELRGEPQPERRQVLQRLVVKLARPVGTFLLGHRDALPASLALDRHRGRDRRGRAGRERLQQALVLTADHRASKPV